MSISDTLFKAAQACIPGGVNSPVRALRAVNRDPIYIRRGHGPYLQSVDNVHYIDYVCEFGPLILGHAYPAVLSAVRRAIDNGLGYGACCPIEVEFAQLIQARMPAMEQVRMVNSGTEACMSVLRLARAATGRSKLIKFAGCYHGHVDAMLVAAGSGATTFGHPSSPGVPAQVASDTLISEFNNVDSVERWFNRYPDEVAAIILEPVPGNMGMILPKPGFLEALRALCDQYGALLILDEVMSGFRVHPDSAHGAFGIKPDLLMAGKILGGGLPVGAYGGRQDLMDMLSPNGPVYQAGTLSGNPVTLAAGFATLKVLYDKTKDNFQTLDTMSHALMDGMTRRAEAFNIPLQTVAMGGMFGFFFSETPVENYAQACACDQTRFTQFYQSMLKSGVYFAPSPFEAGFVSLAHHSATRDATLNAAEVAFSQLAKS